MYVSTGGYYYQNTVSAKRAKKSLHINRVRFIRAAVMIALFACSFLFGAMISAYATDEESAVIDQSYSAMLPSAYVSYSVQQGDTLWMIAKSNLPVDADIREFIQEIKAMNHLETSMLQEGQLLQIPTRN